MASGITWSGDLKKNLDVMEPKIQRAMVVGAHAVAPMAEEYMKNNATWTDRTGNARNGLKADVITTARSVTIVLYHQVPYGPYLETRWSGRYQIIAPAIEVHAPILVRTIAELAFK